MEKQEQKQVFRKMEEILFSYNKYTAKIKKDLNYLKNPVLLKNYSLDKLPGSNFMEVKSDLERIEELKIRISNNISRYEEILFRIDSALDMVKDHKDYNFIKMRYINNMTYEEISEKLETTVMTTYRMRNRILEVLEIHFRTQRLI
ncbi:MAG: transcriptional regulator [Fusobacterium gastrosuis]|uniref:transcriptional regulator n=1 Tax=Fusobacterium TaxID=848 RepID=UPI0025C156EF|nr:transcriptional regulator [Fusobacterium sp.]MCI7223287.1 transcriptional regulator [Fusobacterium sp.]MDY4011537.1 transcriptional regulator [Fusobacterium gastrosuis]